VDEAWLFVGAARCRKVQVIAVGSIVGTETPKGQSRLGLCDQRRTKQGQRHQLAGCSAAALQRRYVFAVQPEYVHFRVPLRFPRYAPLFHSPMTEFTASFWLTRCPTTLGLCGLSFEMITRADLFVGYQLAVRVDKSQLLCARLCHACLTLLSSFIDAGDHRPGDRCRRVGRHPCAPLPIQR